MFEVWLCAVGFCGPPASGGEETDPMCAHRGQQQHAPDRRRRMGEFRGEYAANTGARWLIPSTAAPPIRARVGTLA